MTYDLFEDIKQLKSIADIGLLYSNNEYDKDLYTAGDNEAYFD
jgi:hypothetical protein